MFAQVAGFLGNVPVKWALSALAALVLLIVCAFAGYRHGYGVADAKGQAALEKLRVAQAEANSQAQAQARQLVESEKARADKLERAMLKARRTIAAKAGDISRGVIINASEDVEVIDGSISLGPRFVRLYNEALGLGGDPGPGSVPPTRTDGEAGAAEATRAGLPGQKVTLPDLLAHVRDVGAWAWTMEAQLTGLQSWAEGRGK